MKERNMQTGNDASRETSVERPKAPSISGFNLDTLQGWADSIPTSRRRPMMLAGLVLLIVFGFGGAWASTAKLGGAIISSGRVIAEGNNRTVQHLEGGILTSILVREGDPVKQGQVIATLDETQNRSQLDRVLIERALRIILLERWRAERDETKETFTVEADKLAPVSDNPRVIEALASQIAEFESTRKARQQKLLMLDGKIANEQEDLIYLKDQIAAYDSQKALIVKEESDLSTLLDQGLTARSKVSALQREISRLDAQKSNAAATIQKSHNNIRSFNDEKQQLLFEHEAETSKNITEVQQKLNESEDLVNRLNDRLRRARILAPVDGVVLSAPIKSIGAVIQPGDKIAEILPDDAPLMLEVSILPKDITSVYMGQDVEAIFPKDQADVLPALKGKVVYISADTFRNPESETSYYISHIEMSSERNGRNILPGNVAEVFFKTEAKTLVQHLADPITRFALRTYKD